MIYKDLEDVMMRLTKLDELSSTLEIAKGEQRGITEMLDLFGVRWHYIERDNKWVAELLPSNKVRIKGKH